MNRRLRLASILSAALIGAPALTPPPAQAATVLKLSMADAIAASPWIVGATVLSTRSLDLRPEGGQLMTEVTLQIQKVYAGKDIPARYTMRLLGGHGADGLSLRVPGMPQFQVGERLVLFLEEAGETMVPTGLGQGVWRQGPLFLGQPTIRRDLTALDLVEKRPDGALAPATVLPEGLRFLSDLEREIAQHLTTAR